MCFTCTHMATTRSRAKTTAQPKAQAAAKARAVKARAAKARATKAQAAKANRAAALAKARANNARAKAAAQARANNARAKAAKAPAKAARKRIQKGRVTKPAPPPPWVNTIRCAIEGGMQVCRDAWGAVKSVSRVAMRHPGKTALAVSLAGLAAAETAGYGVRTAAGFIGPVVRYYRTQPLRTAAGHAALHEFDQLHGLMNMQNQHGGFHPYHGLRSI